MQEGLVYAVEFSHRSGRDLINVAKKRTNIIPIVEDARHPHKYRMLVGMSYVDLYILNIPRAFKSVFLHGSCTDHSFFVRCCLFFLLSSTCTEIFIRLYMRMMSHSISCRVNIRFCLQKCIPFLLRSLGKTYTACTVQ